MRLNEFLNTAFQAPWRKQKVCTPEPGKTKTDGCIDFV